MSESEGFQPNSPPPKPPGLAPEYASLRRPGTTNRVYGTNADGTAMTREQFLAAPMRQSQVRDLRPQAPGGVADQASAALTERFVSRTLRYPTGNGHDKRKGWVGNPEE